MKSRIMIALVTLTAVAPALAEVPSPEALWQQPGDVQPACYGCASSYGDVAGHAGTVWGTDCLSCGVKPGLFPPCPNPCQTTLLGELVYDVRNVVDCTLSTVFGCVFGHPCGCRGACTCVTADCDPWIDAGDGWAGPAGDPSIMGPVEQPLPPPDGYGDPFRDEPAPTPAPPARPVAPAVGRPLLPRAPRTTARPQPRRAQTPQAPTLARRVSHDVPVAARPSTGTPYPDRLSGVSASPLQPSTPVARHYQPRRPVSLRRASGETLELAPVSSHRVPPALRFRSAN